MTVWVLFSYDVVPAHGVHLPMHYLVNKRET